MNKEAEASETLQKAAERRLDSGISLQFLLFLLFVGVMGVVLLLPSMVHPPSIHRAMQCRNNLKHIMLALHNYHDAYKCFPPACIADEEGRPMHSWRVLILPYIEEQALYAAYNFNEPWNGPNNRKLAAMMPREYRCTHADVGSPMTSYVAVTGPGTLWPGNKVLREADVRDGTANTIMCVEVADSDFNWMEPRDVTLEELLSADPASRPAMTSNHTDHKYFFPEREAAGYVITADSDYHFLDGHPRRDDLKALFTIDGGESVDIEKLDFQQPPVRIHWPRCIGLAVFLVSFALLFCRPLPKSWTEQPAEENHS